MGGTAAGCTLIRRGQHQLFGDDSLVRLIRLGPRRYPVLKGLTRMKILFATLPGYGHIYPVMPLVQASASAGHEVVVATGEPFLDRLPVPTVPGIEAGCDISTAMARTPRLHPQARGFDFGLALFGDVAAGLTMPALQTQLERWKPDLVIYETTAIGAG